MTSSYVPLQDVLVVGVRVGSFVSRIGMELGTCPQVELVLLLRGFLAVWRGWSRGVTGGRRIAEARRLHGGGCDGHGGTLGDGGWGREWHTRADGQSPKKSVGKEHHDILNGSTDGRARNSVFPYADTNPLGARSSALASARAARQSWPAVSLLAWRWGVILMSCE